MNDFEAVRQLISSTTGMDAADIKPDSDLAEFGLGKLDFTELLNELEDTFDIIIDGDEDKMHTVNDIVSHIVA